MKTPPTSLAIKTAAAFAVLLVPLSGLSEDYYYFGSDNTLGASTGTNYWVNLSAKGNNEGYWSKSSASADLNKDRTKWSDRGLTAVFAGTAGTVMVNQNITVAGLTFNTGGYTITSGVYTTGGEKGRPATTAYYTLTLAGSSPVIYTNNLDTTTISAVLAGYYGMNKTGTGTLVLTGANTYTGTTTVSDGTLVLANVYDSTTGHTLNDSSSIVVNGDNAILSLTTNEAVAGVTLTSGSIVNTNSSTPRTLTSTSTFDMRKGTVGANLGGSVGLTKTTADLVTLAGANTYTGTTTVSAGTLLVSGSLYQNATTTRTVSVANTALLGVTGTIYGTSTTTTVGGTLYGTGTLEGTVVLNSGSTITGGDVGTIGELNIGTLTINGGTYTFDFSSSGSDLLDVGTLTLSGTVLVSLNWLSDDTTLSSLVSGTKWTLIDTDIYDSASTGSYKLDASDLGSYASYFSLRTTEGGDLILTYANVPEPATYAALLGLGTLGFAGVRRWRSKRRAS